MNNIQQSVPVITLDGPSGTGKGTLCHRLAHALGWHVLDSGAIYRVLAYASEQQNLALNEIDSLVACAKSLPLRFECGLSDEHRVFLNDQDISALIRLEECGQRASQIATIPEVRAALLARQRAFALLPGLVTDGRDMGTVVFPQAILKIYLHASQEARAMRRYMQLNAGGNHANLAQVADELQKRDARDSGRVTAPLIAAEEAVHIDTTNLSVTEVFDVLCGVLQERGIELVKNTK